MKIDDPKDTILKFLAKEVSIRVTYVDALDLARKVSKQNKYSYIANYVSSQCFVGAIMLASQSKEGQKLGLFFEDTDVLGNIYVETNYLGQSRGYVEKPFEVLSADSKNNLKSLIGFGKNISVTEKTVGQKIPHVGLVESIGGDVSEEISYYITQSRQINNICKIFCEIDDQGQITTASGFLIELLQEVSQQNIDLLIKNIEAAPSLIESKKKGQTFRDLVKQYFNGFVYEEIESKSDICLKCTCSNEKTYRTLKMLGQEELNDLAKDPKGQKISCQMCGQSYDYTQKQLKFVADNSQK